jgi:DNA-binding beta-propeller fold protein YncE
MKLYCAKIVAVAFLAASMQLAGNAQTIEKVISFPNAVSGISTNPVTNTIYVVAPSDNGSSTDNVAVISGVTDTVVKTIPVPAGAYVPAVDYFSNRIYIAGCNPNAIAPCVVSVIDGEKKKVIQTIPITSNVGAGFGLTGITVNPLNGKVYVANGNDNVIDIIDGYRGVVTGTIALAGKTPVAIAINPINQRLYVPFGDNTTDVIDANKAQILSTTTFGSATAGVAVNFYTGNVFVTDAVAGPSNTGVFDKNGALLATVPVGDTPFGVDVDPVTNLAFVASTALENVTVIDGSTNTVKTTVFDIPAFFVAVNYATQKVYLSGSNGVTVLHEK